MAAEKLTKQVMDVSKPGKTPATASSRPVIVGHKTEIQDPMVTAVEEKNPETPVEEKKVEAPVTNNKKVIAPLTVAETTDPKAEDVPATEAATEEPAKEEPVPKEKPKDIADEPNPLGDASVEDEAILGGDKGQANQDVAADEEKKHQEKIDELVASKKYFVPIGKIRRRKSRMTALLVLFIIIGLAGIAVIAIDAEIVDVGVELPFHVMPQ